ncbi:MAG TPA: hypothetical protein VE569_09265 [Acidimicrobiia bacterium]|nr:hypothetical protein [Acidimicrobiia bacterium]
MSEFEAGDLVAFRIADRMEDIGVVSLPITMDSAGHVLTLQDGSVVGVKASVQDVEPAGEGREGFAQLAHNLIKLASHVIEQRLLI